MKATAPSQMELLRDYAKQLKRHTKGRLAVHINISRLEKHHQESLFRRKASANIKPFLDKFIGSRNFSLSNNDLMLLTHEAGLDDIEPAISKIRKVFKDDPLIRHLDPVQGQSDDFTTWYDLEKDFMGFLSHIDKMYQAEKAGEQMAEAFQVETKPVKKAANSNMAADSYARTPKHLGKAKAVKIERTDAHDQVIKSPLNAEIILKLEKFITVMDIAAYVRSHDVAAIVGKGKPTIAMIERSVSTEEIVRNLIRDADLESNVWLRGYLTDLIADRLIKSDPELKNKNSLGSIVPLTVNSLLSSNFDSFAKNHNSLDRASIIIEISMIDFLSDTIRYAEAETKARRFGYKLAIGNIDPLAFTAFDISMLDVDFFKISWRPDMKEWLVGDNLSKFKKALMKIGLPRVIISDCQSADAINSMRAVGAILFQGPALANYQS